MPAESILHIAITLVFIPIVLFLFSRFVTRSDEAKKEARAKEEELKKQEEASWRKTVQDMFTRIESKLTTYCQQNHKEHDELYTARNDLMERVAVIENTHHQRGCDQPRV